jgi:hypothetical protein
MIPCHINNVRETIMKNFKIAKWNEELNDWKILESFSSYDDADEKFDYYSDKFPNAYVDILEP